MTGEAAAHEAPPASPVLFDEEKARRSFLDFMTKVTQYEELVDAGKRFLVKFHQELGIHSFFTKSPLLVPLFCVIFLDQIH